MLRSMGDVESPSSDHQEGLISTSRWPASTFHFVTRSIPHLLLSLKPLITGSGSLGKADEGGAPLVPSVPLLSGDSRLLRSLRYNEVWAGGEKPQTNQPLWLWTYWHKFICCSWHYSSFHHTTELRVENAFPEKLFFSCTFCGEGKTIIEKKKEKNRRWKGQHHTIVASSAPVPLLNCPNLASSWHNAGDACQSGVEETWTETPSRNLQSQARSILSVGLWWAH